jgi:hypothetical protein
MENGFRSSCVNFWILSCLKGRVIFKKGGYGKKIVGGRPWMGPYPRVIVPFGGLLKNASFKDLSLIPGAAAGFSITS